MTRDHHIRLTRPGADRLLDGGTVGIPGLEALLHAAGGEPSTADLAGHGGALVAFRESQLGVVSRPRRRTMIKTALASSLAAKLTATAAVAAAATGGIALAASTGVLPVTHTNTPHPTSSSHPGNTSHPSNSSHPTDSATETDTASASPSPNLRGLCTAFQAGATSNAGKVASNPAFSALTTAAGGAADIGTFCTTLLATSTPTGKPTDLPTGAPSSHPTGKPTDLPTGAPSSHH